MDTSLLTREPFSFQRIAPDAARMRRLVMSLRAIGDALSVDEKTVRKALQYGGGNRVPRNG